MLSGAAWPPRRRGAENQTGDAISPGAGLLREIKPQGKPQPPPTRVYTHTRQPQTATCEEPAHPGQATGELDLHTEF